MRSFNSTVILLLVSAFAASGQTPKPASAALTVTCVFSLSAGAFACLPLTALTGPTGPAGPAGPAGPTGTTGPAGPQGMQGPAGVAGSSVAFRGPWSIGNNYNVGDVVSFNGSSYVATIASGGVQPDKAPGMWAIVAQGGVAGAVGSAGPQGPQGPAGAPGTVITGGTCVSADGSIALFVQLPDGTCLPIVATGSAASAGAANATGGVTLIMGAAPAAASAAKPVIH